MSNSLIQTTHHIHKSKPHITFTNLNRISYSLIQTKYHFTNLNHISHSHMCESCHTQRRHGSVHNCTMFVLAGGCSHVCCSVLQCDAMCCSVLQCVAVCCSVLQCVAACCSVLQCVAVCCSVLQCVVVCCNVLQCVPGCCSVLHSVAECCTTYINLDTLIDISNVAHCANDCAVCCIVLQCFVV